MRLLFRRYHELGNVRSLQDWLDDAAIRVPERILTNGRRIGGGRFARGQLYFILRNRIYVGEIPHRDTSYPGQHPPIIKRALFDAVQAKLAEHTQGERRGRSGAPSLLAGKIVDGEGEPLLAVHACKGSRRYRYYVSQALQQARSQSGHRIPAREIETAVCERIARLFDDPFELASAASLEIGASTMHQLEANCHRIAGTLRSSDSALVERLVVGVRVLDREVEIECSTAAIAVAVGVACAEGASPTLTLRMDVQLTRSGHVMRLIQSNGAAVAREPASSLIKPILQARRWWSELRAGNIDMTAIAKREGLTTSYVSRIVRLAFLSPAVIDAILAGRQRDCVDRAMLSAPGGVPADWKQQEGLMLAAG